MPTITILYLEHTMNPLTGVREPCMFPPQGSSDAELWRSEHLEHSSRANVLKQAAQSPRSVSAKTTAPTHGASFIILREV